MRRLRRIRARHARRVFRALIAVTVVFCLAGVGTFAWLGVEQAGAARRAAESSALAAKDDHSAEKYARMVAAAREYNRRLAATPHVIGETSGKDGTIDGDFGFKSDTEYQNLLDFGDGIMATIEIPSIGVDLPVRHGADAYAVENGAGHLHGTSLPVGGQSTHSVITGHTGVADKALFTRLTELRKGDVFYVRVAAQTLAYKVERIRKVDPDDLRDVRIQPGRDLVTLVTCTPIFLNTYRLLVTGERVSMPDDAPYPEDAPRESTMYSLRWGYFSRSMAAAAWAELCTPDMPLDRVRCSTSRPDLRKGSKWLINSSTFTCEVLVSAPLSIAA